MRNAALKLITDCGLIPVIRAEEPEEALGIAEAIKKGGVSVLEITMTVPGAIDVIKEVSRLYKGEILLGAGTVLDPETIALK